MKKLKVDLEELALALDDTAYEHSHYLDLQTGELILLTEEVRRAVEEFPFEENEEPEAQDRRFREWMEESGFREWEKELLPIALEVEGASDRYLYIQPRESREAYQVMVDFAETVEDEHLQELLCVALNGSGAFRRFKDVLYRDPEQQKRWYQFRDERQKAEAREWLEVHEIELLEE